MTGNFKVAGVNFLDGTNTERTYWYALYDDDIVVGDTVVVKSGHHGLGVAKVVSIDERNTDVVECGREIIAKVDFSAYEERKAKEQRKAELKKNMDAKVKQLQEYAIFEMLAEKDTELSEMLEEYKALIN